MWADAHTCAHTLVMHNGRTQPPCTYIHSHHTPTYTYIHLHTPTYTTYIHHKNQILEECGFAVPLDRIRPLAAYHSAIGTSGARQCMYVGGWDVGGRLYVVEVGLYVCSRSCIHVCTYVRFTCIYMYVYTHTTGTMQRWMTACVYSKVAGVYGALLGYCCMVPFNFPHTLVLSHTCSFVSHMFICLRQDGEAIELLALPLANAQSFVLDMQVCCLVYAVLCMLSCVCCLVRVQAMTIEVDLRYRP